MESGTFSHLYLEGLPRTVRFLISLGFSRDSAYDVAQSAWAMAWERLDQLREDDKILSWVNAIALREARRNRRIARQQFSLRPSQERLTTLNTAAIDLQRVLELCAPEDREILEAQLEGASSVELADERGVSRMAMRLRYFRARRAARAVCESAPNIKISDSGIGPRMRSLTRKFQENCIRFGQQHLRNAETFILLLQATEEPEKRKTLRGMVETSIKNAMRSFARIPGSRVEVAQGRSRARELRKQVQELMAAETAADSQAASPIGPKSVAPKTSAERNVG